MKTALFVLVAIVLAGCATTQKSSVQTQQLQSRINYLEAELQRKDQEISLLEREERDRNVFSERRDYSPSSGSEMSVKQMQRALKNAGFYKGSIDGKMGPQTKAAITAFQKARGLKADGVAGKRTQVELRKY